MKLLKITGITIAFAQQAFAATNEMTLDYETPDGQSGMTMTGAQGCC